MSAVAASILGAGKSGRYGDPKVVAIPGGGPISDGDASAES